MHVSLFQDCLIQRINKCNLTNNFPDVGAAIVFWIASIFTRKEHVPHEDLKHLFFAALFGIVFNQGTYIFGVSQTSPIDATIVAHLHPHHHHDHRCFLPEGTDYGNEDPRYLCRGGRCPDAYSERTANGGNRKRQQ